MENGEDGGGLYAVGGGGARREVVGAGALCRLAFLKHWDLSSRQVLRLTRWPTW